MSLKFLPSRGLLTQDRFISKSMKILMTTLILLSSLTSYAYELDRSALSNGDLKFISHHRPDLFHTYLSMEIRYLPIQTLLRELETNVGSLKNRGEAHITVITPVEYDNALGGFVTIQEINRMAVAMRIQQTEFVPVCVGSGTAELRGKSEKTYFIVVKSEELLKIRRSVKELFVNRGGDPRAFDAEKFYPHITLGFTEEDLHESQGVIKNQEACLENGQITIR